MRTSRIFKITDVGLFRSRALDFARQYREAVVLDSNDYGMAPQEWDLVVAVDALTSMVTDHHHGFDKLDAYQKNTADWLFGYLSYDLKNDTEPLVSRNEDGLAFPELFFFQPKKVLLLKGNALQLNYLYVCDDEMEADYRYFLQPKADAVIPDFAVPQIVQKIPKADYVQKVDKILKHIGLGDVYEVNFCMAFYAEQAQIDPYLTFEKLNALSNPPFAAFLKNKEQFVLSASPERYLRKTGSQVVSQPIKGTAPRFADADADKQSAENLRNDPKERAENIMIVDLVRNDLSRTAAKESVSVTELCGIYAFAQVHQMISTVTSQLEPGNSPVDVLCSTFPMGSMTGAPKIAAMEIIEALEATKRGVYSGAVGYFTPGGDFDFNVVIRSILFNKQKSYLSFSVGSAITSLSVAEKEYEECLLKAKALFKVLQK